jgi:hypothetical protein
MNTKNYNGWTNYATWRVNLEMFDGMEPGEHGPDELRDLALDLIEQSASGLALDYAMAFLSDVNWYEIAAHLAPETETENN